MLELAAVLVGAAFVWLLIVRLFPDSKRVVNERVDAALVTGSRRAVWWAIAVIAAVVLGAAVITKW